MRPEFSRPIPVEAVLPTGSEYTIEATAEERDDLARRFAIPAITAFSGRFMVRPWRRGGLEVRGEINADVEVVSVVSLDVFSTEVSDDVVRYYQAETGPGHRPTVLSVESLEGEEPDVISGGTIDLGEIAAESLALALDPYPRKPGEVFEGTTGTSDRERQEESPFAVLARLRKR